MRPMQRQNIQPEALAQRVVDGRVLYSHVVVVEGQRMIFVADQLARDAHGHVVGKGQTWPKHPRSSALLVKDGEAALLHARSDRCWPRLPTIASLRHTPTDALACESLGGCAEQPGPWLR